MRNASWKRRNTGVIRRARLRSVFYGGRYEETRIGSPHLVYYDISSADPACLTKAAP